jgi:hypothetical protein
MSGKKSTNRLYEYHIEKQKKTYRTPENKEELEEVLELLLEDFSHNKSKVFDRVFELSEIFYKKETNEKLTNDKDLLTEFIKWKGYVYDGINNDFSPGTTYNPFWGRSGQEGLAYTSMKKIMDLFFNH